MNGRCWYCTKDDVRLTDEHVLSEANFGGRLVARKSICQQCNGKSGELEDQLARSVGVAELVGRFGRLINPRRPPRPQTSGIYSDRGEITVSHAENGLSVKAMTPRHVGTDPDGTDVWEVAAGDEARFVARRRKRGEHVRAVGRPLILEPGMNMKYGMGERNIDVWPRIGAKVALSMASIILPSDWLNTRGARALQYGFHHGTWDSHHYPGGAPWQPCELPPTDEIPSLLRPGEHVVGLDHDDGGRAWMILFGTLMYAIRVHDAPIPVEECVWLLSRRGIQQQKPRRGADLLAELRRRHTA